MVSRAGRIEELRGRAAALVARLEELEEVDEVDGQDRRARSVRRKLYDLRLRIRNFSQSSGDISRDVSVMDEDVCDVGGDDGDDGAGV